MNKNFITINQGICRSNQQTKNEYRIHRMTTPVRWTSPSFEWIFIFLFRSIVPSWFDAPMTISSGRCHGTSFAIRIDHSTSRKRDSFSMSNICAKKKKCSTKNSSRRTEQWADLFIFLHCWSRQGERYSNNWIDFLPHCFSLDEDETEKTFDRDKWMEFSIFSKALPFLFLLVAIVDFFEYRGEKSFRRKKLWEVLSLLLSPIPFAVWEKMAVLLQMFFLRGNNRRKSF